MNLKMPWSSIKLNLFRLALKCRKILPKQKSFAFGSNESSVQPQINRIYVINLDRQKDRWVNIQQELKLIVDSAGYDLLNMTERYPAIDATHFTNDPIKDDEIDPVYTLWDQLLVEPQPSVFPAQKVLDAPINMSWQEIAIAKSHINIWKRIVSSNIENALILEDDVWFRPSFGISIDQAWNELTITNDTINTFDVFYVSFEEVKHGAPKAILSKNVFRPYRGLWHLSGYVVSRQGAQKLLNFLPCKGPIDLWLNLIFEKLDVRSIKSSVISQRRDVDSSNSYSILPSLTKIGAINSETAALFHNYPIERPVFAFGCDNSGLTSLAMALSMLGYRCCSDIESLPENEHRKLLTGNRDIVFDAYVNIANLFPEISNLKRLYPQAKFIVCIGRNKEIVNSIVNELKILDCSDVTYLDIQEPNKWKVICEHLRCAPPVSKYPDLDDLGARQVLHRGLEGNESDIIIPKRDKSPWIIERKPQWNGIQLVPMKMSKASQIKHVSLTDSFVKIDEKQWYLRDDTFADNMALFRPANIDVCNNSGLSLNIKKEYLGIRNYSAASISSRDSFLYGRFEAIFRASNSPGVITGFFLHRDSPRQEIDIEIIGENTYRLLLNVFYNPGCDGAKYDFGYRGASTIIDLGFDASIDEHRYTIEWEPNEIRWFVDNILVHRRVEWDPTPIPNNPMVLHFNTWPCRSTEIAGKLKDRKLPTSSNLTSVNVEANIINKKN